MSKNPVAIITGASSGIGAATAQLFAKNGYRIVLAARREERIIALADEIKSIGGEAIPIKTDVAQLESINNMISQTLDGYGQVDLLFNNAGFARQKWLEEMDPDRDIALQIQVNILGVIQTTRAVLPHMIKRRRGHIINMSSMAGYVAPPTYTIYSATKHAVRGFSEALRREVGVWGIRVSTIYPASVATEFTTHTQANYQSDFLYPEMLQLNADRVAESILRVARFPRSNVILPGVMYFAKWLNILIPGLIDKIIELRFVRPERGL
jgi:NADP-dependent 3-hydroxy acid dehydrogenase YdfG